MHDALTSLSFAEPGVIPVAIFTLSLLLTFLVASWLAAWYEERTRRATASIRKGALLPTGFGSFHGVARALDQRAAGDLVVSTRTQVIKQGVDGAYWLDVTRSTSGENFVLAHEGGEEIEVDIRDAVLEGFTETSTGAYQGQGTKTPRRELSATIHVGDAIWVTGVLGRPPDARGGAYRSGVSRRKLRAPKRRNVMISTTSPALGWRARARAHKIGSYSALGALVLLHVTAFRGFDVALVKSRIEDATALIAYDFHPLRIVPGVFAVVVVAILYGRQLLKARDQR